MCRGIAKNVEMYSNISPQWTNIMFPMLLFQVDFVEFKNQEVLSEFMNALERTGGKGISPKPLPGVNLPSMPTSPVILEYGNIADQNVRIKVNGPLWYKTFLVYRGIQLDIFSICV